MANKNTSPKKKTTSPSNTTKDSVKKNTKSVAPAPKTTKAAVSKTKATKATTKKIALKSAEVTAPKSAAVKNISTSKKPSAKQPKAQKSMKQQPENQSSRIIAIIAAIVLIGLVLTFSFKIIPDIILRQTDDAKIEKERIAAEEKVKEEARLKQEKIEKENSILAFENQTVVIETSAGDLHIDLNYDVAPKTVENFLRLSYRDYYDNTNFFEIQKSDVNNVIIGGTQANNGLEGVSATEAPIEDEFWNVQPDYADGVLSNEPSFKAPQYFDDVDLNALNTITYKKGVIAMYTDGINLGQTRFFITLADSSRQPGATVFGRVQEEDFDILDSILNNFNPSEAPNTESALVVSGITPELKIKNITITKLNEGDESTQ